MTTDNMPAYLADRIRQAAPVTGVIVPGSTPVLAFGNARRATIATLGLNPSRVEFLDRSGRFFSEEQRRLETFHSLGVTRLDDASDEVVARVIKGCDTYFQRNPYWQWFRPLDSLLARLGVSYSNGTACHLDLVQWATDPVWSGLALSTRQALIAADASFLHKQLQQEQITILLLNGRSVISTFATVFGVPLRSVERLTEGSVTAELVMGMASDRITVVGWSTNLQSSFGVSRLFRARLADAVARQVALV